MDDCNEDASNEKVDPQPNAADLNPDINHTPGPSRECPISDSEPDISQPSKKPKTNPSTPDESDKEFKMINEPLQCLYNLQHSDEQPAPTSEGPEVHNEEALASTSRAEMSDDNDHYRRTRRRNPLNPNDVSASLRDESSSSSSESDSDDLSLQSCSDSSTTAQAEPLEGPLFLTESDYNVPIPSVLQKPAPKHKWSLLPELRRREIGGPNYRNGNKQFEERMHGSLHAVERLELMYKLEEHEGCVNGLNFNKSGSLIASCSDDLSVCLWDWAASKVVAKAMTGHKSNVFQSKFLPLGGHIHVVTCGRDGQVRLLEFDNTGGIRHLRRLGSHKRPAHKLACIPDSPHCFMSCAEDALISQYDVRLEKPIKLLEVLSNGKLIPQFSISCHPTDVHEFLVAGRDIFLRLYDRRNPSNPLRMLHPDHFISGQKRRRAFVTHALYNYNGTQILASYNDDDIYLWDRKETSSTDAVHRYQGHRNSSTLKGVNFFGPRSEFIVSGSDCGNIFFWERESEAIVKFMAGDENGVVNCLEPHPSIPVIATSGLDSDVKVWISSCESAPIFKELKSTVIANLEDRRKNRARSRDARTRDDIDAQMLYFLWRQLHQYNNRFGEHDLTLANPQEYVAEPAEDVDDSDTDRDPRMSERCQPS